MRGRLSSTAEASRAHEAELTKILGYIPAGAATFSLVMVSGALLWSCSPDSSRFPTHFQSQHSERRTNESWIHRFGTIGLIHGSQPVVTNRARSKAEPLKRLGTTVVESPAEAAAGVEVLITMLADDRAIDDAVLGPGQALEPLPSGALHVSMSAISVALSKRLQSAHREKQQHYVAAPVLRRKHKLPRCPWSC
jgi:hypothetical protein